MGDFKLEQGSHPQDNLELRDLSDNAEITEAVPRLLNIPIHVRVLLGVFSLGISEGLFFIFKKFYSWSSEEQHKQELDEDQQATQPAITKANQKTARLFAKSIPDEYLSIITFIMSAFKEFNELYDKNPERFFNSKARNNQPLRSVFAEAIRTCPYLITSDNLRQILTKTLDEEIKYRHVRQAVLEQLHAVRVSLDKLNLDKFCDALLKGENTEALLNLELARKYVKESKLGEELSDKVQEIKENQQEIQAEFLNSVAPEVVPLTEALISGLPLDAEHKGASRQYLNSQLKLMQYWHDLTFKDKLDEGFYAEFLKELQEDYSKLKESSSGSQKSSSYVRDLHKQLLADAAQLRYVFNGQELKASNHKERAAKVTAKFEEVFSNELDLQFMSKLANQSLINHLLSYLDLSLVKQPSDALKNSGLFVHNCKILSAASAPVKEGNFKAANSISLKVNGDQSEFECLYIQTYYLVPLSLPFDELSGFDLGTCQLQLKVAGKLVKGSAEGIPQLESLKIAQSFAAPKQN
ncbi:MAG: hypothetical protein K6F05_07645 [Succinivibrio sp.]|nr:hypothetical protein [Succinivibrio sp.]